MDSIDYPSKVSKTSTSCQFTVDYIVNIACLLVTAFHFETSEHLSRAQGANQLRFLMSF